MTARVRERLGITVFDAALDRLVREMSAGHRLVVSFSTGKDSCVTLELALLAARLTSYGPVDVVLRDEEILLPGSYEYADEVAQRPDVRMTWLVAHQPILNIYNRQQPYWWVFDPLLSPGEWVREPPSWATSIPEMHIEAMTIPSRFPVRSGQKLMAVMGLRVQESRGRLYGLFSSGGYLTKPNSYGVIGFRPVYDWTDGDVWRAIAENKWRYNKAYDTLRRLGVPARQLRIAPPTMNMQGASTLKVAASAWPSWFERVSRRCPGVRQAALFGRHAVTPRRRYGETWEQTFHRECIHEAPEWIAKRARRYETEIVRAHERHASGTLPEIEACYSCEGSIGSWKQLTMALYNGDPFSIRCTGLPYVEPEFFRPGAGTWQGKPSF